MNLRSEKTSRSKPKKSGAMPCVKNWAVVVKHHGTIHSVPLTQLIHQHAFSGRHDPYSLRTWLAKDSPTVEDILQCVNQNKRYII